MMNELNELIQEIVDFGDVIAYNDNPADADFQNACNLFSNYLEWRLAEITEKLRATGEEAEIQRATREIEILSDLITPPQQSTDPCIQWTRNLFRHCMELRQINPTEIYPTQPGTQQI